MDTIVIGAGVAGLTCASELVRAGSHVVVLEKSRGVGGRCATRRMGGQPVDHGIPFLHGDDPRFLEAVRRAIPNDRRIEGWPRTIQGDGKPCMRRAFAAGEWRGALRDGINRFPRSLAADLDVRRETRVDAIEVRDGRWVARDADHREYEARDLVVGLPAPQAAELLGTVSDPAARSAAEIVRMVGTRRCLAVLADYGDRAPEPEVDLWLPGDGRAVHQIVHDSAKRDLGARRVLVVQALPSWSAERWAEPTEVWVAELLAEAASHVGAWCREPETVDVQRWRYARSDGASEFRRPMLVGSSPGPRLGLAGEVFSPGGGVQGAWRSGRELARRMIGKGT